MAKQSPVNVVDSAPYTSPSANELVIRTKEIVLNPADVVVQSLGILLEDYPAILGRDVAGQVVEVHHSLADSYEIGDRVIGAATFFAKKGRKILLLSLSRICGSEIALHCQSSQRGGIRGCCCAATWDQYCR
jgi:NADPH:quinone reductase-like Zn-dependent oxidoreductase